MAQSFQTPFFIQVHQEVTDVTDRFICNWINKSVIRRLFCFFKLLCKKFEYPVGGDINYSAFIQAIDSGMFYF